jgi:hypothetical protein
MRAKYSCNQDEINQLVLIFVFDVSKPHSKTITIRDLKLCRDAQNAIEFS